MTMTKAQMINHLVETERALHEVMEIEEELYGIGDALTSRSRSRWCVIYSLCKELGIKV